MSLTQMQNTGTALGACNPPGYSRSAIVYLLAVVLSIFSAGANAGNDYYFGVNYTYTTAETYNSILGGTVSLLAPSGFSYFPIEWIPPIILVKGELSKETALVVRQVIEHNNRVKDIYFDSPGGDLFAGLELGRIIKKAGLNTVVQGSSECESACALAFLAGTQRVLTIGDTSKFGFHRQYYIIGGQIRYGSWAKDVGVIRQYLGSIGANSIMSAEEVVDTTGLATFSSERLRQRQIATRVSVDVGMDAINAGAEPKTMHEYFRTLCHTVEFTRQCVNSEPEIDEVTTATEVIFQKAALSLTGNDGDGYGFLFSAMTPAQFEQFDEHLTDPYQDNEFLFDCLKASPSFQEYLLQRKNQIEAVIDKSVWPTYEQTYQSLVARCSIILEKVTQAKKAQEEKGNPPSGGNPTPPPPQ